MPRDRAIVQAAAGDAARQLATTHYENFPVGSLLVPRRLRPHLHRIYAFARTADDLADEAQDAAALAAFRAAFTAALRGQGPASLPLFVDLLATIHELELPESLFFDLLDAFALDLAQRRHDARSLEAYCAKSANPVGRLVLRVFGHRSAALDALSDRICTGLQLLNHLQDIGEDLRCRDRIYFPGEDLARFGVAEADLRAPAANSAVRALAGHWRQRVQALLHDGWPLTGAVRGRLRLELRAIIGGAAACLRRIRRAGDDVLAAPRRLRLSPGDKLSLPLRAMLPSLPAELRR